VVTTEIYPNDSNYLGNYEFHCNLVAVHKKGKVDDKVICYATEKIIKVLSYDPCTTEKTNNDLYD